MGGSYHHDHGAEFRVCENAYVWRRGFEFEFSSKMSYGDHINQADIILSFLQSFF